MKLVNQFRYGLLTVLLLSLVVTSITQASSDPQTANDPSIVETISGPVQGTVTETVRSFQGIPFAAPPIGDLRWQSPQPVEAWTEPRDATQPGSRCPQAENPAGNAIGSTEEDCLYLNVMTPLEVDSSEPKPVMVWIHGGGMVSGAGSDYDPELLVTGGDVIVVTFNYRLGALGFFGYPGLPSSGSFGLEDQQAALNWVQQNITAFGGDPENVTIFGESAGGDSVCAQLTSPLAAELFQRAIMQSGSCTTYNVGGAVIPGLGALADTWKPLDLVVDTSSKVAADLGCTDAAAAMDCLRDIPAADLLAVAATSDGAPVTWSPAIGTEVLPIHPGEAVATGEYNQVPLMTGFNRDEGRYFAPSGFDIPYGGMTEEIYTTVLDTAFGENAQMVAERYPLAEYDPPSLAWADLLTDRAYACPNLRANRLFAAQSPIYAYEFADQTAPMIFTLPIEYPFGAYHGAELAYLFNITAHPVELNAEQQQLSDQMIAYWTNFAHASDPNGDDLPVWEPFSDEDTLPQVLAFDSGAEGIQPTDVASEHQCDFWDGTL